MNDEPALDTARIAIVGLGYVGLPLAVEFGKQYDTVGFDINAARIAELRTGHDSTREVEPELIAAATRLQFSAQLDDIRNCNVFIVTVPTPIDAAKRPDLTPLVKASEAIGSILKPGDVVIYESTVYPGCTEEVCVPILEKTSGLKFATSTAAAPAPAPDLLPLPPTACRPLPLTGEGRGEGALAPDPATSPAAPPLPSTARLPLPPTACLPLPLTGEGRGEGALAPDPATSPAALPLPLTARLPLPPTACLPLPLTGEGRGEGALALDPAPALPPLPRAGEGRGEGALDLDLDLGSTPAPNQPTFTCGYSPERINPGDKAHRVTNILKVTSGSTPEAATFVDNLYKSIITAGTHKASCIKVAEAAKVIENTQRDLNIALVNDLAILFNKLGIDTLEVLEAAGTKWNFLPFRPGLVGGHCISVDPYYLTHKAQEVGHHPDVILAGRRTNDAMGGYIAGEVIRLMVRKGINPVKARVLILGLAFKENCPDLRNTRVVDIVQSLHSYHAQVDVFDPWVDAAQAQHEYAITPIKQVEPGAYDAVIVAVGHDEFRALGADGIRAYGKPESVLYDVKYVLPRDAVDGRL